MCLRASCTLPRCSSISLQHIHRRSFSYRRIDKNKRRRRKGGGGGSKRERGEGRRRRRRRKQQQQQQQQQQNNKNNKNNKKTKTKTKRTSTTTTTLKRHIRTNETKSTQNERRVYNSFQVQLEEDDGAEWKKWCRLIFHNN